MILGRSQSQLGMVEGSYNGLGGKMTTMMATVMIVTGKIWKER
jgi:hypothetical protein